MLKMHIPSGIIILLLNILNLNALSSLRGDNYSVNINMPDVRPDMPDSYLCTAKRLNPAESYIVQFEPDASGHIAHHMLLFGCKSLHSQNHLYPGYWNCGIGDVCNTMAVMYGWAKNAPSIVLPPDVGFLTGGNSSIQYLVLQIHYASPLPDGFTDNSGLKLYMTMQRQPYITGIHLMFADSAEIPPFQEKYHIDVNCKFDGKIPIHPFAYRVHTHKLGTVVTGYKFNMQSNNWTFLSKGNPQWPQAFYPMKNIHTITNNDILAARCTYNSTRMSHSIHIGSSSTDEMCNLYIMYYTEYRNFYQIQTSPCVGVKFWSLVNNLPLGNDIPLPPNLEMEQQTHYVQGHTSNSPIHYNSIQNEENHSTLVQKKFNPKVHSQKLQNKVFNQGSSSKLPQYKETNVYNSDYLNPNFNREFRYKEVPDWPSKSLKFGQIAGVAVDNKGNAVIFHRGNHVWNDLTFDIANNYKLTVDGPISSPTVIVLDSVTGQILSQWGRNLFFMPHGIFISADGDFWLTDVALHQVFKFSSAGSTQPLLILGERFVPGKDKGHFCKPTSVAVSSNGDIYVADGYCNSRIIRFSSEGSYLNEWGKQSDYFELNPPPNSFSVPHKVILIEDKNLVCVADRENGRIQCFTMVTGYFRFQIHREEFGGSLYSISYSNDHLYAVSGEAIYQDRIVKAFVFNISDQKLLNVISPDSSPFTRPHDIAVSKDCNELYVCEIGPKIVWKFIRDYHKSSKKVLNDLPNLPAGTSVLPVIINEVNPTVFASHLKSLSHDSNHTAQGTSDDVNNFETSLIIMALLAIPVLMLVIFTTIVRLRKRGKLQHCSFGHLKGWLGGYRTPHSQDKFNIGNLLNPHKGFDRVAMEESDAEGENGSESDIEEFSAIANKA